MEEIARHCRVHRDTLRKSWMRNLDMPIIKIRGRWYASRTQLEAWLIYPYRKRISEASPPNPPDSTPEASRLNLKRGRKMP